MQYWLRDILAAVREAITAGFLPRVTVAQNFFQVRSKLRIQDGNLSILQTNVAPAGLKKPIHVG